MHMKLKEAFIKRLKNILKERGLTQYALFKISGVPQSTISSILNSNTKSISFRTIYDICSGLGMEFSEFFDDKILKLENIDE